MRKLFELIGTISVNGIETVNKQIRSVERDITKAMKPIDKFGHSLQSAGFALTKYITTPLLAASGLSLKFAADFDESMTRVYAVAGDVTEAMKRDMRKAAIDTSKTSKFMAKDVGDAMMWMASAGYSASDSIAMLPLTTRFATAGLMELEEATNFLIGSQNALGLKSNDVTENLATMTRIADVLTTANNAAFGSVRNFSEALTNKAAASMRLYNVSIEEGVSALAVYATQAKFGAEAGESYAIVMRDMQRAAIVHKKAFKENGIEVFDAAGKMNHLADILAQLEERMKGVDDESKRNLLQMLGFQEKSISATMALLGTSKRMKEFQTILESAGGSTKKVSDDMMKSFTNQLKLLRNELVAVSIEFGEELIPVLRESVMPVIRTFIGYISSVIKWFKELDPMTKKIIIGLGALAVVLPPVLIVAGQLIVAVKALALAFGALFAILMANPITLVVAGFAVASVAMFKFLNDYKKAHKEIKKLSSSEDISIRSSFTYSDTTEDPAIRKKRAAQALQKKLEENALTEKIIGEEERKELEKRLEKKSEIEKEYRLKLLEEEGDLIAINKLKWNEELKSANEVGAKVSDINFFYKTKEEEIRKEQKEKADKLLEEDLKKHQEYYADLTKKYDDFRLTETQKVRKEFEEQLALAGANEEAKAKVFAIYNKKMADAKKSERDAEIQGYQNMVSKIQGVYSTLSGFVLNITSSISNILSGNVESWHKKKVSSLEAEYAREQELIDQSVSNDQEKNEKKAKLEKQYSDKKSAIEAEYQTKQRRAKRAAAVAQRANDIISSVVNTAVSVTALLWNPILAGIAGALGAAQTALIAVQPLPAFAGGATIKHRSGGIQAIVGEGNQDEVIFPLESGVEQMASKLVSRLGKMTDVYGTPIAGLSSSNKEAYTSGFHENHWHIGTLIADERSLKELERRQNQIRISEDQRKGL